MPHIIIEYSQDNVSENEINAMISKVFDVVKSTMLFDEENIKVRSHPVQHYKLGLTDSGFIHIQCRIHAGKTTLQKQRLTQSIVDGLKGLFSQSVVITAEVADMDKTTYAKAVLTL